ncbi:Phosphoribulokinase [Tritrichomonas foetus]|uniref:Phosphoribulokinase n=1 Tax=Tritrichomonas foetus TaxID=1144522 RepID=A0A1J4L4U7_9EUKA|nr:Phosphoribulokinase [Tritrichomonas foetus]|eukprot:OHT16957.1 Phosphoribulokinase [Tritrichomonas foetus]
MSEESILQDAVVRSNLLAEHASLTFIVCSRYYLLFNHHLKIEHSLGDGLYCTDPDRSIITQEMCDQLTAKINEFLNSDEKIELVQVSRDVLVENFTKLNQMDKVGVLKSWLDDSITCIKIGNIMDYAIEPCSTDKERLKIFEIRPFADGLVLRYPKTSSPNKIGEYVDQKVLHDMFKEYAEWAKLIDCDNVSKLNEIIYKRKIDDLKWVAEGLHEQKLTIIADHLVKNFQTKRVITIAGPSSSNKTTFAKRLAISLRVLGFQSTVIEMDDYFKNNVEVPFGEDGLQDFEHISAMNVKLLAERVSQLLNGERIPRRRFNFKIGEGVDSDTEFLQLPPRSFLILEGIHGLNPELLDAFGRNRVTPIYVSALTPLNIDSNHRFPTSSLRLIRRMVRDYRYRGRSPRNTLLRWGSVRRGEENNIFPYQANAELWFNSALVYELPVLAIYAKGLLAEASIPEPHEDPNSIQSQEMTKEALRLQSLLNFFYPVSVEVVPHISCIREFVGGSDLKY